jgi:hypothetical protein
MDDMPRRDDDIFSGLYAVWRLYGGAKDIIIT